MSLRVITGEVTVLLGPSVARRRLVNRLDDASARSSSGHGAAVLRLRAHPSESVDERLARLRSVHREVGQRRSGLLLADRFTDGLPASDRRALLAELRAVAASGLAVLVDDIDPVAALAVADRALRVDVSGAVSVERLAYLAS